MKSEYPSPFVATAAVVLLTAVWGYVRLIAFGEDRFPLTFVLPLLICVWTMRVWHIWAMAAVFSVMAVVKLIWIIPAATAREQGHLLTATLLNIVIGAVVIRAIVAMRQKLEARNATISAQNAELEAQTEELFQQNEEIKAQSEELAQQNEEIEMQAEEVARQNEDLTDLNARLSGREAILEGLLDCTREQQAPARALDELCTRTLQALGSPAVEVAILRGPGEEFLLQARSRVDGQQIVPERWPIDGSLAGVVLREKRTAYISDLPKRPDLLRPFGAESPAQSVLVTPLALGEETGGLLVAVSREPAHWTEEQFRIVEWVAAQCGLLLSALQSQQVLAAQMEALDYANQSKDRFLAMLSHELRTPVTPVLALAGALEADERLPEDVREGLSMIRRNVAIQSRLIDDLLDLTRISRGKVELDRQRLGIAGLLRDTVSIVEGDIAAKGQKLVLALGAVGDRELVGDGPRLQQVFWNLLKNATKFSPEGAEIQFRAGIKGELLQIEVQDSGIGIEPQDLERIFLPFEQKLVGPRRATDTGLGLGLAIAQAVVEMHGGKIVVRSDGLGCGATFVVSLPLASEETESEIPNGHLVHDGMADHHPPLAPGGRSRRHRQDPGKTAAQSRLRSGARRYRRCRAATHPGLALRPRDLRPRPPR